MIDLSKNNNTDTYNNTCRKIENGVKSVTAKGYKTPNLSNKEYNNFMKIGAPPRKRKKK
mgnify:CR=1 FL=1|jgi:uncharacterized protein YcnI|tara:strand:+ start:878 stop:1054 length:177 start_codon:yes stop_codon:yes gene_type:complete